jgi:hypothetical protein
MRTGGDDRSSRTKCYVHPDIGYIHPR